MDANVYSLAGNLIRELRDKIKSDVEKEVYGLTAGRGRDMKIRVDRLEGEVESLHSVIKLKDKGLAWWRQTVEDRGCAIEKLEGFLEDKNRTIKKLQERVDALTFYPPETGSTKWECVGCGGEVWRRAGWGEEERRVGSRWRKKWSGII